MMCTLQIPNYIYVLVPNPIREKRKRKGRTIVEDPEGEGALPDQGGRKRKGNDQDPGLDQDQDQGPRTGGIIISNC